MGAIGRRGVSQNWRAWSLGIAIHITAYHFLRLLRAETPAKLSDLSQRRPAQSYESDQPRSMMKQSQRDNTVISGWTIGESLSMPSYRS